MILTIRTNPLRKAGKQGLIAIQKQVTKKGKTFTQTFYVKPDAVPKRPTPPMAVTSGLPAPTYPKVTITTPEGETVSFESNRPEGGFFVLVSNVAVRIPEKHIIKTVQIMGHTFVIHRDVDSFDTQRFGDTFAMTELKTGLRLASGKMPGIVEDAGKADAEKYGKERVDEVISSRATIEEFENIFTETDPWGVKEGVTPEELRESARAILEANLDGDDGSFTLDEVVSWLSTHENIEFNTELPDPDDYDDEILREAIAEELSYEDSKTRYETMDEIYGLMNDSEMFYGTEPDTYKIFAWGAKHEDNLVDGINEYNYGTTSEYGETGWSGADVITYAVENDISLDSAQSVAEDATAEEDAEMSGGDVYDLSFTNAYDVHWDGEALTTLGSWTGGQCKSTRDAANTLDDCRRQEVDENCENYNEIIQVIEDHMVEYQGTVLYRGTGNPAWLTSEIGDTVEVGAASFSKSEFAARGFNAKIMLIMEQSSKEKGNPIKGVDIIGLIEDAREEGFNREDGFAAYPNEEEFAVRAPALRILRREGNKVWVTPVEMSLLEVMKSLFEEKAEREKAMARTFDYHMRQDTEDKWV